MEDDDFWPFPGLFIVLIPACFFLIIVVFLILRICICPQRMGAMMGHHVYIHYPQDQQGTNIVATDGVIFKNMKWIWDIKIGSYFKHFQFYSSSPISRYPSSSSMASYHTAVVG